IFAVEWQPDRVVWYLDGTPYFTATPNDAFLQGKQWVFNHPFFMLLNVAVGGSFGGPVGPDTTFPQKTWVDYVRLYQAKPTIVQFDAAFDDAFSGWQKVTVPYAAFKGPKGKILDVTAIRRLGFEVPGGMRDSLLIDQIRLTCPSEVTVTSTADAGGGSLRAALGNVCADGTVRFATALAGQTVTLLSGPLTLGRNVTVDGSAAPGVTISGNNTDRVFIVNAGTAATLRNLTVADGYGWQFAGGILNNGALTLDHAAVTRNTMATNAGDFWQGGGGIYNGDGAALNLIDSSVTNNQAGWSGGGIYSFFNSTTSIARSTISGNVSGDVGGGIRSLANVTIANSTISGNTSTGWHGGAIFHTDGAMEISSSTIADNIGPDWAPSTIFIGEYGSVVASLKLTNTIVTGNRWYACEQYASGGAVSLVSDGHNLVQDASCSPVASDLVTGNAMIGPLAGNGGPTLTHALLSGSPAIDAADGTACPATDQRGTARPQGTQCDIGSYESTIP
ncbi:MAG: hypothetical protein H6Q33_4662, partial [Deltaproteobacteria bacterium]|nr:hypothetical protein [Deltaproteobacteria bacterium]